MESNIGRNLFLVGLLAANTSFASTAQNVSVAELGIYRPYGNIVFVRLTAAPTSIPACSTNGYWNYTLTLDGVAGKEMYAMLLSAQASGKLITVTGTAACSDFSGVESLQGANVLN